jgi:bifunctional DNA-binding transcriptional regulator/antitoxin component of YhaV-PrlF toxin-antitoxin module
LRESPSIGTIVFEVTDDAWEDWKGTKRWEKMRATLTVRHKCLTLGCEDSSMTKLTITAKGQVTLKQELLRHLGVGPGEKVEADQLSDGRIIVRAAAQDGSIDDFIGCLSRRDGPKLTIEKINEIAARGWAKRK